jgi:non-ribosomal peptide synthetase component F
MAEHFQMLLNGIARNPDESISTLPLLSQTDKNQLIVEWNGTKRSQLGNECIHQLFEAQALKTPLAIALICRDQQLSYGELNSRANQIAHCLREMGVGPDIVVGICLERSLDLMWIT